MPNEDRDAAQPLGFGSSAGLGPLVWVADWWYEHLADGKQSCAAPAMMWPDPHDKTGLVPLYDQAALDAAVAAERERWIAACNTVADGAEAAGRPGVQTVAQVRRLAIDGPNVNFSRVRPFGDTQ